MISKGIATEASKDATWISLSLTMELIYLNYDRWTNGGYPRRMSNDKGSHCFNSTREASRRPRSRG